MTKVETPYLIDMPERPGRQFAITTKQAHDWYSPLSNSQSNELRWLIEYIDFGKGRVFLDAGCHHGYYTVALGGACRTVAVDIHHPNLVACLINCKLNDIPVELLHGGIAHETGYGYYDGKALGGLRSEGVRLPVYRIQDFLPEVNVVKLDIEASEYYVIPSCIDALPEADTWIIEFHAYVDSDDKMFDYNLHIKSFFDRGYKGIWFDRAYEDARPEPIKLPIELHLQSTFVFRKG